MALEPITRTEQIIAGKDLEPITRMERFLKDYGVSNYFGETTVKGDTLTWDGDTDGLVSIGDALFKVSDTVLNYDDFADGGFECNSIYGVTSGNQSNLIVMQEFGVVISIGNFYSFPESAVGVDVSGGEGMIPPESGTYFTANMRSLTIPNYTGFEATVIKPMDAKYLPEHLQFGTETKVVEGDTLTWDGNTEGLVSVDALAEVIGILYKISDAVPTLEDCISGATYTVAYDGGQLNLSAGYDEIVEMSGFCGCLCIGDFYALVAPENNFQIEIEGVTAIFPEAGLYTAIGEDTILTSLTIPGYNGFVSEQTVVTPLAEQYMPILTSPSGKKFKLSVDDSGVLLAVEV